MKSGLEGALARDRLPNAAEHSILPSSRIRPASFK